ncbi:MAG: hypothetical protein ACJ763_12065, partial [Bdellovibrionia bacterium]
MRPSSIIGITRKTQFLKDTVVRAALTVVAAMSLSGPVFAQDQNSNSNGDTHRSRHGSSYHHHRERSGRENFVMGMCVGQTLAQRGVTLPMPEPGKPPQLDASQEDAFQGAIETCRASMSGRASPTPGPTSAPSSAPSPALSPDV